MTEIEDKAGTAWAAMFCHAMPAGIALDFLQDVTDDRATALESPLVAATCATANARPSVKQAHGSFPDFEAGAIGGAVLRGGTDFAVTILKNLVARLHQQELNPSTELVGIKEWLDWCEDMELAVKLCRELCDAAGGPPTH